MSIVAAFIAAFATVSVYVTSFVAFVATKAWKAIKAIFVIPVIPVTPDASDAPEPQLVSVLRTVPDDDWIKTWPVDKTLMLMMTSKNLNEVINKMQLPKPEVTITLCFDNNKESQDKMKSLSMFVKKNKIAKLEIKCSNLRINRDDLHKVALEEIDAPEEWFEKVSEHYGNLAILNDQANSIEPVLDTCYAYWIQGGPNILLTFQP